ncbi:ribonuclease H-like protein [Rhizoclosmatium globosum]|uniref:Ribonuclease H-like protein n=1 Tax=Rhizoclosmatium globosum TaxID=329046 RepID=A0A1Y2B758_9FUNG|nr:ribonuclease H-like protein [Rhizoclosmatium globosum]|eukprot:ORY30516.1 ribonuclease H-like protein [Rhizoclosmatium globosum]
MRLCGIASLGATKKDDLASTIARHLFNAANSKHPSHVLAIDIGFVNLGHARISRTNLAKGKGKGKGSALCLDSWAVSQVDSLDVPYWPPRLAANLDAFLGGVVGVAGERGLSMKETACVIERQHWKPTTCTSQSVVRCAGLEAMLFGIMSSRSMNVCSVAAAKVAEWHSLESGKKKKQSAVDRVHEIIGKGTVIEVPKHLADKFKSEKKKDDMADALLIGLTYCEWLENTNAELQKHSDTLKLK